MTTIHPQARRMNWLRIQAIGFAALSLMPLGCDLQLFETPTAATKRTVTVEYRDGAPIEVRSRLGNIHVTHDAARTDVQVEAEIRCGGLNMAQAEERAEKCELTATYSDAGSLSIEPAFPDKLHHRDGATLQITVPSGVRLVLHTSNGEITVRPVQESMIDSLEAETSNAQVNAMGIRGDVTVETQNGPIRVVHVGGSLVANTSNAPITASDVVGELRLESSNGPISVELQADQSGPIQAKTSNAPIAARVASGFNGRINVHTSNAAVAIRDPHGLVRQNEVNPTDGFIVVGDGASTSQLTTSNGKIVVHIE